MSDLPNPLPIAQLSCTAAVCEVHLGDVNPQNKLQAAPYEYGIAHGRHNAVQFRFTGRCVLDDANKRHPLRR